MKKTRAEKGITLIALIITIIVLLILAVVTIGAIKNDGIIQYAQNAKDDYQKAQNEEETQLQNYLNILNEETKTETEAGEKYEVVPVGTNCEKYYVDVDKETEGPEGIIYIDKANTTSGSWNGNSYTITNVTTGLKEYYISKESHTTTEFGTAPVLSLVPGSTGEERFYVMALKDEKKTIEGWEYSSFYWYYNANLEAICGAYATLLGPEIGAGKTNTSTMLTEWNATTPTYGAKHERDMWGVVEDGWYIPSIDEWVAFGLTMEITSSNYSTKGLGNSYMSSTVRFSLCL